MINMVLRLSTSRGENEITTFWNFSLIEASLIKLYFISTLKNTIVWGLKSFIFWYTYFILTANTYINVVKSFTINVNEQVRTLVYYISITSLHILIDMWVVVIPK